MNRWSLYGQLWFPVLAILLLGACSISDLPDPETGLGAPLVVPSMETAQMAPQAMLSPQPHWLTDRGTALALLKEMLVLLPIHVDEQTGRPEDLVVGNWRRDGTYAFQNGRFSDLQARERPFDFPSHAWFFTDDGTFRRTMERFAWSGRATWTTAGADEPSVPGWHVIELEEVMTSPPVLPFGERQLALVAFVGDVMFLVLWEDTRLTPPDLVWRFVRYSGLAM